MKRQAILVLVMVVLYSVLSANVEAVVVFDDGLPHDIATYINDIVEVRDNSVGDATTLNLLLGGQIQWQLYVYDNSYTNIFEGSIENDLWFYDESQISISGGAIKTHLTAHGHSRVEISGAIFGENYTNEINRAYDYSTITISGGEFGVDTRFGALNNGRIVIHGTDFNYDYGTYTHSDFPSPVYFTGILANGDPINNSFQISDSASIVLTPEPATVLLLGFGGLALLKKRT